MTMTEHEWPETYHPMLVDLGSRIVAELTTEGLTTDRAWAIAMRVTDRVRVDWGKQTLYFPAGRLEIAAARAREIRAAFRGNNIQELAREHGLTEMRVRQILKAKS